jgi:ABC-type nitrate/sulfonate/bicarbonate transport system substrate-binding protein
MQSVYSLPILVAQREGFFRREGLDLTITLVRGGGEEMIKALDSGEADLVHVATPFLIKRALAGSDAVAIGAEFDNPIYSLIARPAFGSFAALKGRRIGMADESGTIAYSMWKLLAAHGVGRADVSTVTLSGTPARLTCLRAGACDAVPLGQPEDFEAMSQGYRRLGLSTDAVPDFVYTVTAARRGWARAHAGRVTRYLRALAAAFRFIRDPANRARTARLIATQAGSEESARRTLALYFDPERHVLPIAGEIAPKALAQVIAFMGESGALAPPLPDPERFADRRYLEAVGAR